MASVTSLSVTKPSETPQEGETLELLSSTSGRQRYRVPSIRRAVERAERLRRALASHPGVTEVRANPNTARVLICFELPLAPAEVREVLLAAVERLAPPAERRRGAGAGLTPAFVQNLKQHPLYRVLDGVLSPRELGMPLASLLSQCFSLLPGMTIVAAVNVARGGEIQLLRRVGLRGAVPQMVGLGAGVFGVSVLNLIFQSYSRKEWREVARNSEHRLKVRLFEHVQQLDMAYLDEQSTARIAAVVNDDPRRVGDFVERGADSVAQKVITVGFIGGAMLVKAPLLACTALLPMAGILWYAPRAQSKVRESHERTEALRLAQLDLLANNLAGLSTVKSFTAEEAEVRGFEAGSRAFTDASLSSARASAALSRTTESFFWGSYAVTAALGGIAVSQGALAYQTYAFFLYGIPQVVRAVAGIEETLSLYRSATSAAERQLEVLKTQPTIQDGPCRDVTAGLARIEFSDVGFGYAPGSAVLDGVDLTIEPGETVGVVGVTGSGKSTLAKLLLRFYEVESGAVRFDGVDVRELSLATLRSRIGYVSQDVYLFHGSIYDNICYGRPGASRDEVVAAAKSAMIHEHIAGLPQGYDTIVGERGSKLSGGQRQRISIARALLKQPSLLVLDEATSSLDNETEAALEQSLRQWRGQLGILMIAHRLSIVRSADRIYVLEAGRVRDVGRHDQLLSRGGLYGALWKMQAGAGPGAGQVHSETFAQGHG